MPARCSAPAPHPPPRTRARGRTGASRFLLGRQHRRDDGHGCGKIYLRSSAEPSAESPGLWDFRETLCSGRGCSTPLGFFWPIWNGLEQSDPLYRPELSASAK